MTASVRDHIAQGRLELVRAGLGADDAALDAEVLARHLLGWDRARLLTHRHLPPPETFPAAYRDVLSRRAAREPVAYITGHREFWGLDFEVTRDVLIPRPETELIIETAILLSGRPEVRHWDWPSLRQVVDVGTGSGCIAIALSSEFPGAHVTAMDVSARALTVAARNVERHRLAGRVSLVRGNLLDAVAGPVNLIVSNPPYVARRDEPLLQPEVRGFEPEAALFADEDGMAVLRRLCDTAASCLAPGGMMLVEFGAGQEASLRAIARATGWSIDTRPDLAGIPRVAVLTPAAVAT